MKITISLIAYIFLCLGLVLMGFRVGQVTEAARNQPQKVLPLNLKEIESRCEEKVVAAWREAQNALDQAHPGWRLRGCYYKSDEDIDP